MIHRRKNFTDLALNLTRGLSSQDRFDRMLVTVRDLLDSEATALLLLKGQTFVPLAINGLDHDVLGRYFQIDQHPRLEAIARAGDVVRFPADSDLPDPYDGLISSHSGALKVHACIGLPLHINDRLIGALTIDGFSANQFDSFSDDELRTVSALAAASLNNALMMEQLEQQAANSTSHPVTLSQSSASVEMIGQSPAMEQLKKEINVVAGTDLTALICGETGVGKELVAAAIHAQSSRASENMVYLNCAALPESVAESELFGHVKGAFTGAISHRKGKFEMADGGTLFLDEVGELSLALQAKLLRVLQYGDLQRIGDDRSLKVDTRIIAATNRDLEQRVLEGEFRADLFHRLSVFPINVPPLRERGSDLFLLAGYFLEKCRVQLGIQTISLSSDCHHGMLRYSWPGNVRELEHCLHRAAVLAKAEAVSEYVLIQSKHFGRLFLSGEHEAEAKEVLPALSEQTLGLREATEVFQRQLIQQMLNANDQSWAATARQLSVDAGNLHRLARRLGLK
ncbi:nitric oxide reductase transcriptional regulator NorR [Endozoicomonas ascidiicola]|uniref:nitric oxide reductase transcriptional regulator NorR n=1 Tax=Endozoicomonas ascidiicola TaxID=1698521 RepID=UPI0008308FA1|nr:nitric oxide reductase transcriptional regulator NorR [Endozoicomonas ascidiicola]